MVLIVRLGCDTSSIRYSRRNDGRVRNSRIIAGRIVQIVSISWASEILRADREFIVSANIAHATKVIIRVKIIMAWS